MKDQAGSKTEKLWKEIELHFLQMKHKIEDILESNQDTLVDLETFHKLFKIVEHRGRSAVDPYEFTTISKIKAKEKDAFIRELAGKMRKNNQKIYDLEKIPFKFPIFGMEKEQFVSVARKEFLRQNGIRSDRGSNRDYKDSLEDRKNVRPQVLEDHKNQARLSRMIFPVLVNSVPEYNPEWKIKEEFPTLFRVEDLLILYSLDHRVYECSGKDIYFWTAIQPFNFKNSVLKRNWISFRVRFDTENFPVWDSDRADNVQFSCSQKFVEGKRFSAKALHSWVEEIQKKRQAQVSEHESFLSILKADQGIENGSISELLESITRSWVLGYTVPIKKLKSPVFERLGRNPDLHTVAQDPEFWYTVREIHGEYPTELLRSALSGFHSTI